ncbi:hypothetical protein OIO90_003392 [Microbotryomycetes sp. JL221]|nr:hypothetical protein OIO90_003392 [Microbotryomycetes sp. JL221]
MSSSSQRDDLKRGASHPPQHIHDSDRHHPGMPQQSLSAGATVARGVQRGDSAATTAAIAQVPRGQTSHTGNATLQNEDDRWLAARRAFHAAGQTPVLFFNDERSTSGSNVGRTETTPQSAFTTIGRLADGLQDLPMSTQQRRWQSPASSGSNRLQQSPNSVNSHASPPLFIASDSASLGLQPLKIPQGTSSGYSDQLNSSQPKSEGPARTGTELRVSRNWTSQHTSPASPWHGLPSNSLSAPPDLGIQAASGRPPSAFSTHPPQSGRQFSPAIDGSPYPFSRAMPRQLRATDDRQATTNLQRSTPDALRGQSLPVSNSFSRQRQRGSMPRKSQAVLDSKVLPGVALSPPRPTPPSGPRLRSGLPERTTWAMWVGNVPADTSERELRRFFESRPKLNDQDSTAGVESNCAFVNFVSSEHLVHAIEQSHGVPLRPNDRKCKPLVCRLRMREDDAKSGVGAQRGAGLHKSYIRERQQNPQQPAQSTQQMQSEPTAGISSSDSLHGILPRRVGSPSSESTASTNSSFFEEHFPRRFFIMKAHSVYDLEQSLRTNTWSTQSHNESVLDQAYRTSNDGVYLVFSANKSGSWFGIAKMAGKIRSSSNASPRIDKTAPPEVDGQVEMQASGLVTSVETSPQSQTSSLDTAGGMPFPVQWITTASVPFSATKHILNSFNSNREIKISRDGTELEPEAGMQLLREFGIVEASSALRSDEASVEGYEIRSIALSPTHT